MTHLIQGDATLLPHRIWKGKITSGNHGKSVVSAVTVCVLLKQGGTTFMNS